MKLRKKPVVIECLIPALGRLAAPDAIGSGLCMTAHGRLFRGMVSLNLCIDNLENGNE